MLIIQFNDDVGRKLMEHQFIVSTEIGFRRVDDRNINPSLNHLSKSIDRYPHYGNGFKLHLIF